MYKIFLLSFFIFFYEAFPQAKVVKLPAAHSIRAMEISKNGNVWISGSKGAIYQSQDSGKTWYNHCPEEYREFDFRGISILSETSIIAMSAGEGEKGKAFLIKTTDTGKTWKRIFQENTNGAFFDTIKFRNEKEGWLLGDPIEGKAYIQKTTDGGENWHKIALNQSIFEGEASFAASNSCIALYKNKVWLSTQNRIFLSGNKGNTWKTLDTPFEKTATQGIFGIFFRDKKNGYAVGGDYQNESKNTLQVAITTDGGTIWKTGDLKFGQGVSESVTFVKKNLVVISGTKGIKIENLKTKKTYSVSEGVFHVVACNSNHCISAGADGNICYFEIMPF